MSEANWLSLTLREGLRKLWEWKEKHKKAGKVEKQQAVVNICVAKKDEMTSSPCTTTRDNHLPPLFLGLATSLRRTSGTIAACTRKGGFSAGSLSPLPYILMAACQQVFPHSLVRDDKVLLAAKEQGCFQEIFRVSKFHSNSPQASRTTVHPLPTTSAVWN